MLKVRIAVPFQRIGTEIITTVVIQHETSRSHGPAVMLWDGALWSTPALFHLGLV